MFACFKAMVTCGIFCHYKKLTKIMKINYEVKNRIEALSSKLKSLIQSQREDTYINHKLKSDDLQYNLSNILADVVFNLTLPDTTLSTFKQHIDDYNSISNTSLTIEDFVNNCWIRIVSKNIMISATIQYYLWNIGYCEDNGKTVKIVVDTKDLTDCLRLYYKNCIEDKYPFISREAFENVLDKYPAENSFLEDLLISHGFIKYDEKKDNYKWYGENGVQLSSDIGALLWMKQGGASASYDDFEAYIDMLNATDLIVWDMTNLLIPHDHLKLYEYSLQFLEKEEDLNRSEKEVDKFFLDSEESRRSIENINNTPEIILDCSNPISLIESIENSFWRYGGASYHQNTRSYTYNLFRFIFHCIPYKSDVLDEFLALAKNTEKPYIVWYLYENIPEAFPSVISNMIIDDDLAPISFRIIDEIKINNDFTKNLFRETKLEYELEQINTFCFEMFDFMLEFYSGVKDLSNKGGVLSKILYNLSKEVFSFGNSNEASVLKHKYKLQRYHYFVKGLNKKRIDNKNIYPRPLVNNKLFLVLVEEIAEYLDQLSLEENQQSLLGTIDLVIEFIRIANTYRTEVRLNEEFVNSVIKSKNSLINTCNKRVVYLFKNISSSFNGFAFEIVDWAYIYLNLQESRLINNFYSEFQASIMFNCDADKYEKNNQNQTEKIKFFLKSLMIAHIQLSDNIEAYRATQLPTQALLRNLEEWIRENSILYSVFDFGNNRTDVFDETFNIFRNYLYYTSLSTLLHRSINNFNQEALSFVQRLYSDSTDLGKLLIAINNLKSSNLKEFISIKIENLNVDNFINSRFTVTELKHTLIEAINSDKHWELAKPLIQRIKEHADSIEKMYSGNTYLFLFEINLLLYFKEKDLSNLKNIKIPESISLSDDEKEKYEMVKQFYVAIHHIYNIPNYNTAIELLSGLHNRDAKNIRYAYHLYKARTYKAVNDNRDLLLHAKQEWDIFVNSLDENEQKGLVEIKDSIDSISLFSYMERESYSIFDLTFNNLSDEYKYTEELIETVFNCFMKREMYENANAYICEGYSYYLENEVDPPQILNEIRENFPNKSIIESLKRLMGNLHAQKETDLPLILPDKINDQNNLKLFLLCELIEASKKLLNKIKAIADIGKENKYNDLLVAVLELRFAVWGWDIDDQPRIGNSHKDSNGIGGKDAGSADFRIKCGGRDIGLWEGLILRDKAYTKRHIEKVEGYIKYLDNYYMIIYVTNEWSKTFDEACAEYQSHLLNIEYANNFDLDKNIGYQDITSDFQNVGAFSIGRTIHGKNKEVFHLIIDLLNIEKQ